MTVYDISRGIHSRTAVWPGDQEFSVRWAAGLENFPGLCCSAITLSSHTATNHQPSTHYPTN